MWLLNLKLQANSRQGILLLFLEDQDDFEQSRDVLKPDHKESQCDNWRGPSSTLFKEAILPRNMFPEICKKFYEKNSDVAFSKYLTTKYGFMN